MSYTQIKEMPVCPGCGLNDQIFDWLCDVSCDGYYICNRCNPDHERSAKQGAYFCCNTCGDLIHIDMDQDHRCSECDRVICNNCIVWNDDEEEDCGEDEGMVFCSDTCLTDHKKKDDDSE